MSRRSPIVALFILINLGVYVAWATADSAREILLQQNFLVSSVGLQEGRLWTLVTSVFSHNLILHLIINMMVLQSFGGFVEQVLGSPRFLVFYLYAGVMGSLAHSIVSGYLLQTPSVPALGASGALAGVILVFSLMFPKEKILLFGFIPLPAIFGALAFIGMDLWGLSAQAAGGGLPIGHGAHLGGAFAGIIYFILFLKRR